MKYTVVPSDANKTAEKQKTTRTFVFWCLSGPFSNNWYP